MIDLLYEIKMQARYLTALENAQSWTMPT